MADKPKHTAADVRRAVERLRVVLDREGLLVCHDPLVPSATALIAGEPVRGTWWSDELELPRGSRKMGDVGRLA